MKQPYRKEKKKKKRDVARQGDLWGTRSQAPFPNQGKLKEKFPPPLTFQEETTKKIKENTNHSRRLTNSKAL